MKTQEHARSLDRKMIKSYFGNFIRNVHRRTMNKISRGLVSLSKILSRKERNPQRVLRNYDEISGVYIEKYLQAYDAPNHMFMRKNGKPQFVMSNEYFDWKTKYLAKEVFTLGQAKSILEVGAGECITISPALKKLNKSLECVAALDLSWSRLAVSKKFNEKLGVNIDHLVVGDVYSLPFADNSFDLVYTFHCLEQAPFNKEQSLKELYRVTRKYLVLIEPSYELGGLPQKLRLRNKNYIRGLPKTIRKLNYKLIKHELMGFADYGNAAAIHVIEKDPNSTIKVENIFVCPESKTPLTKEKEHFFCKENGLLYPVIDNVALLDKGNAIVASKYLSI